MRFERANETTDAAAVRRERVARRGLAGVLGAALQLGAGLGVGLGVVVTTLVTGLAPSAVHAQLSFDQARAMLDAPTTDEVRMGIETLGMLGRPDAVAPITARIRKGLPPDLLVMAIDTLGILGRNEAGPILFELVSHRRPEVRLRAVQAIATCRPRGADRALVVALGDASPAVRSAAAQTLADVRATGAVESLFLAFDHDVIEAGPALATLCRGEDVPRLLGYLGRLPFATLRPMLLTVLRRTDLPVRARMDVVSRVGELATPDARGLLEDFVTGGAEAGPLRRAAEEAMNRIAL